MDYNKRPRAPEVSESNKKQCVDSGNSSNPQKLEISDGYDLVNDEKYQKLIFDIIVRETLSGGQCIFAVTKVPPNVIKKIEKQETWIQIYRRNWMYHFINDLFSYESDVVVVNKSMCLGYQFGSGRGSGYHHPVKRDADGSCPVCG